MKTSSYQMNLPLFMEELELEMKVLVLDVIADVKYLHDFKLETRA